VLKKERVCNADKSGIGDWGAEGTISFQSERI
jgi:hypothetical protein